MGINEKLHTDEWVKSYLSGDATLAGMVNGVWSEIIPEDKELPAIRFSVNSQHDTMGVGTARIITTLNYLVVVAIEDKSVAPAVPIADRIDTLLHGASGETATLYVLACVREEPFTFAEVADGRQFRYAGGVYRTIVQAK